MKQTLFFSIICSLLLISCNNSGKTNSQAEQGESESQILTIDQVLDMAESHVDQEVYFQGVVSHVCSQSGKKAFLVDSTGNLSLRVEAKGEIKGFNRELSGSKIAVKGIVRENQLSSEFIDDWEQKVKAKKAEVATEEPKEGGEGHCDSEMSNILKMREWMKEHNKDYYSVYYIDGTSYEIIE